ncbi:MAG: prepilin-type N-terminal cleavage/methylation domain-containing protein [Chitinispirillia bacterium]|nr:prepilin-type N-terminal cleavage/methylation domain-containing protein [Chitinispirillia bacterium]MCL2268672.1 prepilin-type N-terminal cleavage/methylation domain-containing protein [Chitinispirillia bacterium]
MMNKKGMTLLELMVYMVLAALILAPIVMLMNNSSKNMARDASNTTLRMSGRDILNIIYDDLKNTGFKLHPDNFKADTAVWYHDLNSIPCPPTTCHPTQNVDLYDESSFMPTDGGSSAGLFDALTVRMGRLTNDGAWSGAEYITYYVDNNKNLIRASTGIFPTATPITVPGAETRRTVLTQNVAALQFQYSEDLEDWENSYGNTIPARLNKPFVQYIRVALILKDDKKLSPVGGIRDMVIGNTILPIPASDQALYERHEIVVPIPNNGLFPTD